MKVIDRVCILAIDAAKSALRSRVICSKIARAGFVVLSAMFLFAVTPTFAQDELSAALDGDNLPSDIPPLPDPRDTDAALYLSGKNVSLFHDLLLAPIASWLKEGKFIARVVRELPYKWELSESWIKGSKSNLSRVQLAADRGLGVTSAGAESGLPFGFAEDIDRETDLEKKAYKILWNLQFSSLPLGDAAYDLEFSWVTIPRVQRRARLTSFSLVRGTESLPSNEPVPVLRSDMFQFLAPPVVFGLAEVSRREYGKSDDLQWIYSPVIGKSRRILSANRGDPLLGSLLSFDDLFLAPSKIQNTTARVLEDKTLLVPFSGLDTSELRFEAPSLAIAPIVGEVPEGEAKPAPTVEAPLAAGAGVLTSRGAIKRGDGQSTFASWNYESGKYPQAPAWIPTSLFFIPRKVWIVEVSRDDPHYIWGRQILVVDKESMLPVYKVVYSRRGIYQKTLIAAWNLALSQNGVHRLPVLAFLVAVNREIKEATVVNTLAARTFLGKDVPEAQSLRRLLDIANHGHRATASPSVDPSPTPGVKGPAKSPTSAATPVEEELPED